MDDVLAFFLGLFLLAFGITTRKWSKRGLLISKTYGPILLGLTVVMVTTLSYFLKTTWWILLLVFPLSITITVMIYLKDKREKED